jgi:diacylglycerol kinase (ATP)
MRVVIIANPAASSYSEPLIEELVVLCATHADEVIVERTAEPGHASKLVESTVDTSTVMLSVGGDGTAREVVHGLADCPDPAPMFIVPAGAANSCYRSFWGDVPWREALAQSLTKPAAHTRRLDLARLAENDKLVLAGASTGFPPQAIHLAGDLTDIAGRARYEQALAGLAATYQPYPGRVLVDGVEIHKGQTMLVNVGGSRYRGGEFEVLPHSIVDDGLLDICVISGHLSCAEMSHLARTGSHVTLAGVTYARGRQVTIERTDGSPLWFEHDGEVLLDFSPTFTLTVLPHAVPMLVGPAADQGRRNTIR